MEVKKMQKNAEMFKMIHEIKEGKMTMEEAKRTLSPGAYKKLVKATALNSQFVLGTWPA